jgi:hypothetical protein
MEAGSAGRGGVDAIKPKIAEIERIDEGVYRANWVLLVDPVLKAFRQKRRLAAICPLYDAS